MLVWLPTALIECRVHLVCPFGLSKEHLGGQNAVYSIGRVPELQILNFALTLVSLLSKS